ncbi:MAG: hypothetical protein WC843_02430 [Candidatus Gracilibacteria bacterium]|jgi:hypothetical protein
MTEAQTGDHQESSIEADPKIAAKRKEILERLLGDNVHETVDLKFFGGAHDVYLERLIPKTSEAFHPRLYAVPANFLEFEMRNWTRAKVRALGMGNDGKFFAELGDTVDLPKDIEMARRVSDVEGYRIVQNISEEGLGQCRIFTLDAQGNTAEACQWDHPYRNWMVDKNDDHYEPLDPRRTSLIPNELDEILAELARQNPAQLAEMTPLETKFTDAVTRWEKHCDAVESNSNYFASEDPDAIADIVALGRAAAFPLIRDYLSRGGDDRIPVFAWIKPIRAMREEGLEIPEEMSNRDADLRGCLIACLNA